MEPSGNQQENLTPTPSRQHSSKIVVVLLVCAVIAGLVFITFKKDKGQVTQKPGPKATTTPVNFTPTVADSKAVLAEKQELQFPAILSSETVDKNQIPPGLVQFLAEGAMEPKLEKVKFEGNKTGYQISYGLGVSVGEAFKQLNYPSTFEIVKSTRANLSAFKELENKDYQVRINIEAVNQNQSQINFLVEQK